MERKKVGCRLASIQKKYLNRFVDFFLKENMKWATVKASAFYVEYVFTSLYLN